MLSFVYPFFLLHGLVFLTYCHPLVYIFLIPVVKGNFSTAQDNAKGFSLLEMEKKKFSLRMKHGIIFGAVVLTLMVGWVEMAFDWGTLALGIGLL